MKTVPVQSSNLARVGYDAERRELRVEFHGGRVVDHVGVPPEAHSRLMSADSHGSDYARNIRKVYPTKDVTAAPATRQADDPAPQPRAGRPSGLDEAVQRYSKGRE